MFSYDSNNTSAPSRIGMEINRQNFTKYRAAKLKSARALLENRYWTFIGKQVILIKPLLEKRYWTRHGFRISLGCHVWY